MPGDQTDDELSLLMVNDVSAGQFSFQYPGDVIVIPQNAGVEFLNMQLDKIGQRSRRKGYTLIANDLGATSISGLIAYNPAGGSRVLVNETNGVVYTWDGSAGTWTSSLTSLTVPSDFTEFVVGNGRLFRLGQTDTIRSFNGSTWTNEGSGNTNFPLCKFAIWTSSQRMLAFNSTGEPSGMFYSNSGDPQVWDRTTNLFRFGDVDLDGLTGAIEFTNANVMVFTKQEMHQLDISNATPSNWTRQKIADIGCEAPRTVRLIGEDALFLSRDGVRSIFQSAQDKKRGASLPISFPIQDYIDRINWQYVSKAVAWVWDDQYILSVPLDTSTYNNINLVWSRRAFEANGKRGGWSVWDSWKANAWATQNFSTKPRLYYGEASADSKVYFARSSNTADDPTTDNGTAISYSETGKRYDFESPHTDKTFQTIEISALAGDSTALVVSAQIDAGGYTVLGTIDLSEGLPTLPIALPFNLGGTTKVKKMFDLSQLGRGRDIQIKLTEATSGASLDVLGYSITAFVENLEILTQ
ncbi:phage stabilization protein [Caudoviricetes sp.]|nr:phage stabilization protein [Caudoviricetes sp.]UOF80994.1 phage stabilization protein [Caudoviricetes sp.]UOF81375.1 phage stabilization protein [Caudoviricetes sp.]